MTDRLIPWFVALLVSLALAAVLIPNDLLFSGRTLQVFTDHDWGLYRELLYYLAGILVFAAVAGFLGGWLLTVIRAVPTVNSIARFLTQSVSLAGLSPIQPLLAGAFLAVLLFRFDWIEPSQWLGGRTIGVILLGLPLSAELALRFSERRDQGWAGRMNSISGVLREQSPALAGRLVWVALGGTLFVLALIRPAGDGADAAQLPWQPTELLIVCVITVAIAFLIWLGGWGLRGESSATVAEIEPTENGSTSSIMGHPALPWGLAALVLLWPVVMTWFAGSPQPLAAAGGAMQSPGSPMLPWTTDWGSTSSGQDLHALLYHAWRGAVGSGLIAAVIAGAVGLTWRFGSKYLPGSIRSATEVSLFRVPPILWFLMLTGLVIVYWRPAMDYTTTGVVIAFVLVPQALRLMRLPGARIPASLTCLTMMGTLLAIGWTGAGLQFLGLMSMAEPTFGSVVSMALMNPDAPELWVLHRGLALVLVAVTLTLLATAALSRAYDLPRRDTRLRG